MCAGRAAAGGVDVTADRSPSNEKLCFGRSAIIMRNVSVARFYDSMWQQQFGYWAELQTEVEVYFAYFAIPQIQIIKRTSVKSVDCVWT